MNSKGPDEAFVSRSPVHFYTVLFLVNFQVAMKYNIFKLEEEGPAFDVKVSVFRSRAFRSKCDRRTIEVCTRFDINFCFYFAPDL